MAGNNEATNLTRLDDDFNQIHDRIGRYLEEQRENEQQDDPIASLDDPQEYQNIVTSHWSQMRQLEDAVERFWRSDLFSVHVAPFSSVPPQEKAALNQLCTSIRHTGEQYEIGILKRVDLISRLPSHRETARRIEIWSPMRIWRERWPPVSTRTSRRATRSRQTRHREEGAFGSSPITRYITLNSRGRCEKWSTRRPASKGPRWTTFCW